MTKRRKLPAPPLALEPVLLRVDDSLAERLKSLAVFLHRRGHLTDGGEKALTEGLEGRNGFYSLTAQDVRSWAQALVGELWPARETEWEAVHEGYFARYDRGKARRPNHLQRLYLDWSRDFSWPGLLAAARSHPFLWDELATAVERLHRDHPERELLSLALGSRDDPTILWNAHQQGRLPSIPVHRLCSLLPWTATTRLEFLSRLAPSATGEEAYSLICACSVKLEEARRLPAFPKLERLASTLLPYRAERHRAEFFTGFRAFLRDAALLEPLWASLSVGDPLHRARFGPRPGESWSKALERELRALSELRSERSSR